MRFFYRLVGQIARRLSDRFGLLPSGFARQAGAPTLTDVPP